MLASTTAHAEVPLGITMFFAALLAGMIVCLALEEKIHAKKSMITGAFAVVCLLLGAFLLPLPFHPEASVEALEHLPIYIPAVEWEVIAIILGASLFVDATSKSGVFTYIAIKLTKTSGGDPAKLLIYYGLLTVLFSAVLNNVTAMIIVGSLSAVSLTKLEQQEKLLGFLMVEGLLTNVGGLLTLISSVPNIIVGQGARYPDGAGGVVDGIEFVDFFLVASPYVVLATIATLALGIWVFKIKRLATDEERQRAREMVMTFDERDGIESIGFFWFSIGMLVAFVGVLATTSVLPGIRDLGMGFVAVTFAVIALVKYKASVDKFYRAVDWDLLFFFVALFVVINVMEHARVLELLGEGLKALIGLGDTGGSASLLASSAAASSVTDNIPLAAMLTKSMGALSPAPSEGMWWSVVFGCNLGGNLTPIGSASTVVAVTIMHKHGLKVSFGRFVKLALPFAGAHIALAILYVLIAV